MILAMWFMEKKFSLSDQFFLSKMFVPLVFMTFLISSLSPTGAIVKDWSLVYVNTQWMMYKGCKPIETGHLSDSRDLKMPLGQTKHVSKFFVTPGPILN